ncbi:MAG: hypothetical protein RJA70_882 [Pseudomonadota bacterium]
MSEEEALNRAQNVLPVLEAREDDVDDVKWALHTAQARWTAGGRAEAVVWMRRAATAADEAGQPDRAGELREEAEELAEQVWIADKPSLARPSPPPPARGNRGRLPPPPVRFSVPPESVSGGDIDLEPDIALASERYVEPMAESSPNSTTELDVEDYLDDEEEVLDDEAEVIDDEAEVIDDEAEVLDDEAEVLDLANETLISAEGEALSGPTDLVEFVDELAMPEPAEGLEAVSPTVSESPELEVEELGRDEFDAMIGPLSVQGSESTGAAAHEMSSGDFAPAPASFRTFDDRLSSVDLEPLSAEAAIARTDSDPSALELRGPDSRRSRVPAAGPSVIPAPAEAIARDSVSAEPGVMDTGVVAPAEDELAEVDGLDLSEARGFEDLPKAVQLALARSARVEILGRGDEVGFFGAALITHGAVEILPAFADAAGAQARQSDVVFTRGSLQESIELRVEAKIDDTRVAIWSPEEVERVFVACPWVADELRFIADYYLAVCGATLGPMGDRLDNSLRTTVFSRMEVRAVAPGELIATGGKPLDGLYVLGGGRIEILNNGELERELSPGDFLFPSTMLSGQAAPQDARAGAGGALLLTAPRAVARELMMSIPPLLEVLSS